MIAFEEVALVDRTGFAYRKGVILNRMRDRSPKAGLECQLCHTALANESDSLQYANTALKELLGVIREM